MTRRIVCHIFVLELLLRINLTYFDDAGGTVQNCEEGGVCGYDSQAPFWKDTKKRFEKICEKQYWEPIKELKALKVYYLCK